MHDVFGAIGSAGDHKEGRGDQRPKGEADRLLRLLETWSGGGNNARLRKVGGCGSCCQFLWLPPQATHSHHRVSLDFRYAAPRVGSDSRALSAKLVRMCEITGIFHRCKIFFAENREFLSTRAGTVVMGAGKFFTTAPRKFFTTGGTEEHRGNRPSLCSSVTPVVRILTYSSPTRTPGHHRPGRQ